MKRKVKLRRNNFLRNKKSFIFLLILCLGVGFAFLSTQLNITGNTSVSGNKWSVYFNNVQVSEGSVDASVVPTTTGTATTSVNYTVLLDKPGDFYEFTVDAVNAGTIDAMIDSITMTSLDTDVATYLNYTATYLDGTTLAQNDVLEADDSTTYKVRVEYKKNIEATDLDEDGINLTLTFGINYVQSTIKKIVKYDFIDLIKSTAQSDSGINFALVSSDSNGKGLYIRTGTEGNTNPIYYYRGNVSNNNAKFAGFCWKIVRTTDTGGTKLIYNGLPDANGQCTNTTGNTTQLSSNSAFNTNYDSLAYHGYMYGTAYETIELEKSGTNYSKIYTYGNTFTYSNGTYTLSGTQNGLDSTHHYTCLGTTTTCTSLAYVNYAISGTIYYILLENGKSVEDAIRDMNTNTHDSTVKTVIDTWFNDTFKTYFTNNNKEYNDYLEDTIWCNDRSISNYGGWNPNGGDTSESDVYYSAYSRIQTGTPSLACSKNDSFTVNETSTGNGALTYPVGLLTTDELNLAGAQLSYSDSHTDFYLYNNKIWWTISPGYYWGGFARNFRLGSTGSAYALDVDGTSVGVRPSISLASTVKVVSGGDGTAAKPYEFVVE